MTRPVLVLAVAFAQIASAQRPQSWMELDVAASVRATELTIPVVWRLDAERTTQLVGSGILADRRVSPHAVVTVGYLGVELPQRSTFVNVPLVAVSETVRLGVFSLTDRNRIEVLAGLPSSPGRYRNRLTLDAPLARPSSRVHLFVDDEAFYDFHASSWNQNRLQVGARYRVASRIVLDLYYLRRDTRPAGPRTPVLGSVLRYVAWH